MANLGFLDPASVDMRDRHFRLRPHPSIPIQDALDASGFSRPEMFSVSTGTLDVDLEWAQKYHEFIDATYTGQRTLDRKTKELLQIAVEAALRADVEQIQAHVRVALQEGATPTEILEALQCVIMPMGALAFRRGLQAWAAETGFDAG